MSLLICPGVHPSDLTQSFLAGLQSAADPAVLNHSCVFPSERHPPYSAFHILEVLYEWLGSAQTSPNSANLSEPDAPSLVFLGFSAGVVGAIGAARTWQQSGGTVKAFIAVDGWGVPLRGDFPLYRLSHDWVTHWSSAPLGAIAASFYAVPPVPHLELWRSPQTVHGWQQTGERSPSNYLSSTTQHRTTAASFLIKLLIHYGELNSKPTAPSFEGQ